jgi:hypothetical protein
MGISAVILVQIYLLVPMSRLIVCQWIPSASLNHSVVDLL